LRNVAGYLKPTTVFIQRFGHLAAKNVLNLTMEDTIRFCKEGELVVDPASKGLELPGYVMVKVEGHFLGAGLLLEKNRLLCRLPKAIRQALSKATPW